MPSGQTHSFGVATRFDDLATDAFIPAVSIIPVFPTPQRDERPLQMYDYTVFMGDMAYNYLALEANITSGQFFPGWPYPPSSEYTYGNTGHLSPASSYASSAASPGATYVLIL